MGFETSFADMGKTASFNYKAVPMGFETIVRPLQVVTYCPHYKAVPMGFETNWK